MSMITMAQQRAALKTWFQTYVTSATKIYEYMPMAINNEELPAIILIPGEASYDQELYGGDSIVIDRIWTARVLGGKALTGSEYEAETKVDIFFTQIVEKLAKYQRIEISEAPDINRTFEVHLTDSGDSGMTAVEIAGVLYAGTDVQFETRIIEAITSAGL